MSDQYFDTIISTFFKTYYEQEIKKLDATKTANQQIAVFGVYVGRKLSKNEQAIECVSLLIPLLDKWEIGVLSVAELKNEILSICEKAQLPNDFSNIQVFALICYTVIRQQLLQSKSKTNYPSNALDLISSQPRIMKFIELLIWPGTQFDCNSHLLYIVSSMLAHSISCVEQAWWKQNAAKPTVYSARFLRCLSAQMKFEHYVWQLKEIAQNHEQPESKTRLCEEQFQDLGLISGELLSAIQSNTGIVESGVDLQNLDNIQFNLLKEFAMLVINMVRLGTGTLAIRWLQRSLSDAQYCVKVMSNMFYCLEPLVKKEGLGALHVSDALCELLKRMGLDDEINAINVADTVVQSKIIRDSTFIESTSLMAFLTCMRKSQFSGLRLSSLDGDVAPDAEDMQLLKLLESRKLSVPDAVDQLSQRQTKEESTKLGKFEISIQRFVYSVIINASCCSIVDVQGVKRYSKSVAVVELWIKKYSTEKKLTVSITKELFNRIVKESSEALLKSRMDFYMYLEEINGLPQEKQQFDTTFSHVCRFVNLTQLYKHVLKTWSPTAYSYCQKMDREIVRKQDLPKRLIALYVELLLFICRIYSANFGAQWKRENPDDLLNVLEKLYVYFDRFKALKTCKDIENLKQLYVEWIEMCRLEKTNQLQQQLDKRAKNNVEIKVLSVNAVAQELQQTEVRTNISNGDATANKVLEQHNVNPVENPIANSDSSLFPGFVPTRLPSPERHEPSATNLIPGFVPTLQHPIEENKEEVAKAQFAVPAFSVPAWSQRIKAPPSVDGSTKPMLNKQVVNKKVSNNCEARAPKKKQNHKELHFRETMRLELERELRSQIQAEMEAKRESKYLCCVCLGNEPNIVFSPCKHLNCCDVCAPSIHDCPACRALITDRTRVYQCCAS